MDQILTLTHATERDVDLVLGEELKCSTDFVRWFANKIASMVSASIDFTASDVTHSKLRTHNRREIDISSLDIQRNDDGDDRSDQRDQPSDQSLPVIDEINESCVVPRHSGGRPQARFIPTNVAGEAPFGGCSGVGASPSFGKEIFLA
ncbi:MAG TPA: hypothetical protein VGF97_18460 [Rhizomicrobium sp.]|jgi:hypothetical protein